MLDRGFEEIHTESIEDNPFRLIGKEWMLVTPGTSSDYNTMTASWGGLGVLWHDPVCFVFVRPTRHTFGFMERHPRFTLSFFDPKFHDALMLCGTLSGRDVDKAALAGLTAMAMPAGSVAFSEARLVIECLKIHSQDLDPSRFLDPAIQGCYPDKDYHRVYVGRIEGAWKRP